MFGHQPRQSPSCYYYVMVTHLYMSHLPGTRRRHLRTNEVRQTLLRNDALHPRGHREGCCGSIPRSGCHDRYSIQRSPSAVGTETGVTR